MGLSDDKAPDRCMVTFLIVAWTIKIKLSDSQVPAGYQYIIAHSQETGPA